MGSKGIRRRKPRRPLSDAPGEATPLVVAGAPNEFSTLTPYGAAMGAANFLVRLLDRIGRRHGRRRSRRG
jgi:hypothetical protein